MRSRHALWAATLAALAGCSGGGGGTGSVSGLAIPAQINIIDSSSGTGGVRLPHGTLGSTLTDYQRDPTQLWVRDESMGPLNIINEILCALDQTNYDDPSVINQGPYIALVDCFEKGSAQSGDRANKQFEEWVVDSSRASDSAPQIVKLWIKNDEDMGDGPVSGYIYVRVVIRSAPSAALPYGDFTLYFKMLPDTEAPTSTATLFQGYLTTVARSDGKAEFAFYNSHGDVDAGVPSSGYAMRERARMVGDPTSRAGRAYTERRFLTPLHSEQAEYQVQYNSDYVARRDANNTITVLDRNNFDTYVWRYGVYDDTTGARIKRFGGFPVETEGGARGWADLNGIWFPQHVTLANGQTLLRRSFSSSATTSYTAVVVAGRLEKRSRSTITLGDIVNEEVEGWDHQNGQSLLLKFDGSNWLKLGTRSGNNSWNRIDPPTNANSQWNEGNWTNLWSAHRGSVELAWSQTPSTATTAYRWVHSTINADSPDLANGDLTLHAYWDMLKANITQNQANYQSGETPHHPHATNVGEGRSYVFNAQSLLLTLGGDPCTLASGVTVTQGPGMNGFRCGPLLTGPLGSFAEMSAQTVTYNWQTGTQPWNQLRTLKDGNGAFVRFEAPLRFDYTHNQTGHPFHSRVLNLQWNGEHLNGIPYEENQSQGRWYPLLNIPSGSTATAGSATYRIKQLEGEQIMVAVGDPTGVMTAQGFNLDDNLTPPSVDLWRDPNIGARPTVTAPPRFVGGVDVSSDG